MKRTKKPTMETPKLIEIKVADRLASLRKNQGLTLRQIAKDCKLSESYLSRIENHKAAINIANLSRVAATLGVPITAFFEDMTTERPISVCRAGQGKSVRLAFAKGLSVEMLAADKKGKLMEPFITDPGSTYEEPLPRSHQGDEFLYVLEGECILHFGKDNISLTKGDSVYFDPRIPHFTTPSPSTGCKILAVVASRDYLFHGDLSRLLKSE